METSAADYAYGQWKGPELIAAAAHRSGQDRAALQPDAGLLLEKERQKENANRATLPVARKLVAYLMAVGRGRCHFLVADRETCAAT